MENPQLVYLADWGFLFVPCHEINPWEHFNQIKDDNLKMMKF